MRAIKPEFIEFTNRLVEQIKNKNLVFGNGNVLIAKPPSEEVTKGGIIIADVARELESRRSGFGKVIALPNNLEPKDGDIPITIGCYVFFTYVSDLPLNYKAISEITGVPIPKETLFYTADSEIICTVSAEHVEQPL